MARNTATRDLHRKQIARTKPPCGICQGEIDYTLPHLDPMSFVVDHILPLGPSPTPERMAALDVLDNKQAAHRVCNRLKSDKTDDETGPRTFITTRRWWT